MIRFKTLALLAGLAIVPAFGVAVAETPAASTTSADKPAMKSDAAKPDAAKSDEPESKMSDADKRAKAVDCSKQADAKKLHGEARKKFRSACKRGK